MKLRWVALGALGVGLIPVWAFAPTQERTDLPDTVDELVRACRGTGATGRELVDVAIVQVARAYPLHSMWHLWETPQRSLAAHRGWSHQYNTVLLLVLRELGFEVRLVHAARVRGFGLPWFLAGHSWAQVRTGGRWLDACASQPSSRAGHPPFVPVTPVLPLRKVTRWAVGLALVPFVIGAVWRAWLTGRDVADWVYGDRPAD